MAATRRTHKTANRPPSAEEPREQSLRNMRKTLALPIPAQGAQIARRQLLDATGQPDRLVRDAQVALAIQRGDTAAVIGTPANPDPMRPFAWDLRSERAAILSAEGGYPHSSICRECSISPETLQAWLSHPDFRGRMLTRINSLTNLASAGILATKVGRLNVATQVLAAAHQVMQERAISATPEMYEDPSIAPRIIFDEKLALTPGGSSGILVGRERSAGPGNGTVTEYVIDKALVETVSTMSQYIARETGQWQDTTGGEVPQKTLINIDLDKM